MANVVASLTINMHDNGEVKVDGCIENKLIAYGLLEIAREMVKDHNDQIARRVQPPTAAERLALVKG